MSEKRGGLEETEVEHVDNNEIVSPVEQVEHEEYRGEQIHRYPANIQSDKHRLSTGNHQHHHHHHQHHHHHHHHHHH